MLPANCLVGRNYLSRARNQLAGQNRIYHRFIVRHDAIDQEPITDKSQCH